MPSRVLREAAPGCLRLVFDANPSGPTPAGSGFPAAQQFNQSMGETPMKLLHYMDPSETPHSTINPGETVVIETADCFCTMIQKT